MKYFLLLQLLFVAIALIGCGDAGANNSANANITRPTGTPWSNKTPDHPTPPVASPTPAGAKKEEGVFPFPPPEAADATQINNAYLINPSGSTTFSFVADRLVNVLTTAGYTNKYKLFRNGENEFAIVTAMEHIDEDGSPPLEPEERWRGSVNLPEARTGTQYFRFLLGGKKIYYRVFAFVVTEKWHPDSTQWTDPPNFDTAHKWTTSKRGAKQLGGAGSGTIESTPFTDSHHCYALLYLFVDHTSLEGPVLVDSDPLNENNALTENLARGIDEHLAKTRINFGAQ